MEYHIAEVNGVTYLVLRVEGSSPESWHWIPIANEEALNPP